MSQLLAKSRKSGRTGFRMGMLDRVPAALTFALLIVLLGGCDETFSPFVEEDRYFSIYGYLDTASDRQMVRVVPLRTTFADPGTDELDVEVRSIEIGSGDVVVWRDSVVTFNDGSVGHVFIGDFRPYPGWTYRFEVERPDGKITSAETTVPLPSNVEISDVPLNQAIATQMVRWSDIPIQPFRVEVWYRFLTSPSRPFDHAVLIYGNEDNRVGLPVGDDEWEIQVTLSGDREDALDGAGLPSDAEPFLLAVGMRLTMTDDAWRPPDGIFNPDVLVQPGAFSNVENGFGFFGSLNQYTVEWTLPDQVIENMGYRPPR